MTVGNFCGDLVIFFAPMYHGPFDQLPFGFLAVLSRKWTAWQLPSAVHGTQGLGNSLRLVEAEREAS